MDNNDNQSPNTNEPETPAPKDNEDMTPKVEEPAVEEAAPTPEVAEPGSPEPSVEEPAAEVKEDEKVEVEPLAKEATPEAPTDDAAAPEVAEPTPEVEPPKPPEPPAEAPKTPEVVAEAAVEMAGEPMPGEVPAPAAPVAAAASSTPKMSKKLMMIVVGVVLLLVVAVGVYMFMPSSSSTDDFGLADVTLYTDSDGEFSLMAPSDSIVVTDDIVTLLAAYEEGTDQDTADPLWAISILPFVVDENTIVLPTPIEDEAQATERLNEYIAEYLAEAEEGDGVTGLEAKVVSLDNSAYGQAMDASYTAPNESDVSLFHRDVMIFNEVGEVIILNFVMSTDNYTDDLSDEVDAIVASLQFTN